jgi:uncharacterized delta-60 repeat protein
MAAGVAQAAPGEFDPSFGSGGVAINQFSPAPEPNGIGVDVAPAPEGKVVVTGAVVDSNGNTAVLIARYLPNGQLDTSFGSGGAEILQAGLEGEREGKKFRPFSEGLFSALSVTSDGHIVVAGEATEKEGFDCTFVMRLKPNGELDPLFGGGIIRKQLSKAEKFPTSAWFGLALQPDGKLVLAGEGQSAEGNNEFVAARLSSSGVPDPTFGEGGFVHRQLGKGEKPEQAESAGTDVLVEPSGELVFSAEASDAKGNAAFALARLTSTGAFDLGFGTAGGATVFQPSPHPGSGTLPFRVVEESSGELVLGGAATFDESGDAAFAIAGFTASGKPDPGFGAGGVTITPLSAAEKPLSEGVGLVREANDKLVLPGLLALSTKPERDILGVLRYTPNGQLDPTFAEGGVLERLFEPGSESSSGAIGGAIDASGRLLVTGVSTPKGRTYSVMTGRILLEEPQPEGSTSTSNQTPAPTQQGGGSSAGTSPPSIPPFAGIALAGGVTLTMDSHGNVTLKLSSPFATSGTVTLTSVGAFKANASSSKKRKLQLGSAKFTIPAGQTVRIKVRLSGRAQALVRRLGRLAATESVLASANGQTKSSSAHVTIKPAKAHHH